MWYSIVVKVSDGNGDFGSNWCTVFDGWSKLESIIIKARIYAISNIKVLVFKGKIIGKQILEY